MSISRPQIDHLIFNVTASDFEDPPPWLSKNFNIIPGGTHSQGTSRNKLIIFRDGTYIELFNWIPEKGHADFPGWADKPTGLFIDFALTHTGEHAAKENHQRIQPALEKTADVPELGRVKYSEPVGGGRTKPDGTQMEWSSTKPGLVGQQGPEKPRLDIPFFCHDVTPRDRRVPCDNEQITTHPCGATGIAELTVQVPSDQVSAFLRLYGIILDIPSATAVDPAKLGGTVFEVDVPKSDVNGGYKSYIVVQAEGKGEEDVNQFYQNASIGLRSVQLFAKGKGGEEKALGDSGVGQFVTVLPID